MRKIVVINCLIFLISILPGYSQEKVHALSFNVTLKDYLESYFIPEGRFFIFITTDPNGFPADKTWPGSYNNTSFIFARNYTSWNLTDTLKINDSEDWMSWSRSGPCSFDSLPGGTYFIQTLWQQNFDGFATNEDGNIRSEKLEVILDSSQTIEVQMGWVYEAWKPELHPHVKLVKVESDTLSKWWGKTMFEYAAVLLPSGYFKHPEIEYPIYYYIGGGDSDCLRAVRQMNGWKAFADWWMEDDTPQIIIVYLDGTKNRNIYHLDSDYLGPHGYSLINEFIPYIEEQYRGTSSPDTRFIGGCSTGGYGSLALQLFYPETFNGVYSYSPDPVSFSELLNINIYEDENLFSDRSGHPTMIARPEPDYPNPILLKEQVEFENVLGKSGTYLDSDQVLGIWSSIFGQKEADGLPGRLVDPITGMIDKKVAEQWSRYDLSKYISDNWERIGPSLQGKIYISCNTADNHYLDRAVRIFESTLNELDNPKPHASVEWAPGSGHCSEYNEGFPHEVVLERIEEKLVQMSSIKN